MDPLVRASLHLQQLLSRLWGVILSAALAVYLVIWATDPPVLWMTVMAAGLLGANVLLSGIRFFGRRQQEGSTEEDLTFFSALTVLTYGAILHLPQGLAGPYYPLVYVLMMICAAYSRPLAALATVLFAAATEAALWAVAFGESNWSTIWTRMGFLALLAVLNAGLFRAEIERVRRVSRGCVRGELEKLQEAARAYRLNGGVSETGEDWATQSAVGEVQQAARYALSLLVESLSLQSAVLLHLEGKKLSVFEAVTDLGLREDAFSAGEGIFSAVLRRKEPISISGGRAAHHALIYTEPQLVGALCCVPVLERQHARGILLVDRREEKPFAPEDLAQLGRATDFLLRSMENERIFASLARANQEQAKLYRAAEALGAATTEADVIEAGVESAREVAFFDFAAVTLFDKKTATHEICAVSGEGAEALLERTFRHNAGLVSMVVANRHALPYRGEYEPSRQTVFARGMNPPKMPSLLVLPLMVHDRVLGTLVLGSSQARTFTQSVRPALEVLASHMAVSLSNARMVKRLEEQATTDGMTGLLNKRTLVAEAQRRLKVATRFKKSLSVLVADIDHFKQVNDTYGHDIGDVVIKGLGEVLKRIKRDTDLVGRFGGEEFVVVCEQTDEEGARNLAERLRRELENTTFQTELGPLNVTASVGVARFPTAGQDWEALFKATDEALYVSKRSGRNRVTVWSPRMRSTSAA